MVVGCSWWCVQKGVREELRAKRIKLLGRLYKLH